MLDLFFSLLISPIQPIKIAVIDTGYDTSNYNFNLCKDSLNLTGLGMNEFSDHGQNVTHLISDNIKSKDYCIIPIKLFGKKSQLSGMSDIYKALEFAEQKKAEIINLSFTGYIFDLHEKTIIERLLNKGIVVVAAAGNRHKDLDEGCIAYPACTDSRVIIVGSVNQDGEPSLFSNYGKRVTRWENGEFRAAGGFIFSGTSQATPQVVAKIANKMIELRRKRK